MGHQPFPLPLLLPSYKISFLKMEFKLENGFPLFFPFPSHLCFLLIEYVGSFFSLNVSVDR